MKKLKIILGLIIIVLFILLFYAIAISFKVKSITDNINRQVARELESIVLIPQVPAEFKSLYETSYYWQMETPQNEKVGVKFSHDTLFDKTADKLHASLQVEEGGDASLFLKVLPAVVPDNQIVTGALDPLKANLEGSASAKYIKYELVQKEDSNQTIKIIWELKKEVYMETNSQNYQKIYSYPLPVLKFLYALQKIVFQILAG